LPLDGHYGKQAERANVVDDTNAVQPTHLETNRRRGRLVDDPDPRKGIIR